MNLADSVIDMGTAAGRYGIALTLAAKWLRPRYTRTSGAGTATCTVVAA